MDTYIVDGPSSSKVIWRCENTGKVFALVCGNRLRAEELARALKGCYSIEEVPTHAKT